MWFWNSNTMHNVLNAIGWMLGGLTFIMIKTGCTTTVATGALDCSGSFIPPQYSVLILGAIFALKQAINLVRDGPGGLFKVQPPVADGVITTVTPVKVVVKK